MDKNDFKKGINDIKQTRLSSVEKERIWAELNIHIDKTVLVSKKQPIVSPWSGILFSRMSYAFVLVMVLGISGVNIFSGAANSLPGDKLYSLKVDVIEPLQYTLAVGDVSRAELQSQNLNQRLLEVEKLESEGRLTDESQEMVGGLIKKHADSFNSIVSKEVNVGALAVEDAKVDFEAKINAHTRILEILENSSKTESSKENINKIKKVIAKEPVEVATAMFASTAEDSSFQAKSSSESVMTMKASSPVNNREAVKVIDVNPKNTIVSTTTISKNTDFEIKKRDTEKFIEDLKKSIEKRKNTKNINKDILDYSKESLKEAESHLIKAKENDEKGDKEEAFVNLMNSRRSAKEADTSLEVSKKIRKDD